MTREDGQTGTRKTDPVPFASLALHPTRTLSLPFLPIKETPAFDPMSAQPLRVILFESLLTTRISKLVRGREEERCVGADVVAVEEVVAILRLASREVGEATKGAEREAILGGGTTCEAGKVELLSRMRERGAKGARVSVFSQRTSREGRVRQSKTYIFRWNLLWLIAQRSIR